jgi:hypothetical protein
VSGDLRGPPPCYPTAIPCLWLATNGQLQLNNNFVINDVLAPDRSGIAPVNTHIDALLKAGIPALRIALSTAMRTRTPQAARIEQIQTVCFPLTIGAMVGGALVLARRSADDAPRDDRGDLELTGFTLCHAIEAPW